MTRVTRSTARRVHFTPIPTPKPKGVPSSQAKPPKTPRKRKPSRGVLPGAMAASMTAMPEMSSAGPATSLPSLAKFQVAIPGASPSPISTVVNNRRRRSGTSFPNLRLSDAMEEYVVNKDTPEMPSSPPVVYRNKIDYDDDPVVSDLKDDSTVLLSHVEIQSTNANQSKKRKSREDPAPELGPAAKMTKRDPVKNQNTMKEEPVRKQNTDRKEPIKKGQTPKQVPAKKHQIPKKRSPKKRQTPNEFPVTKQKAAEKLSAKKQKMPATKAGRKQPDSTTKYTRQMVFRDRADAREVVQGMLWISGVLVNKQGQDAGLRAATVPPGKGGGWAVPAGAEGGGGRKGAMKVGTKHGVVQTGGGGG
ncbi:hypothetical protein EV426DRAFT_702098 [Tirmania nivea]|nr:hypothetical protein EV426DRAFT_702098 [Tirmania nivea]